MARIEEIDEDDVAALKKLYFEIGHEPADSEPKIIPHHDDALHPPTVALTKGLDQLRILFAALGVEPLLELVEHQQQLLAGCQEPPPPQRRQGLDQAPMVRQVR